MQDVYLSLKVKTAEQFKDMLLDAGVMDAPGTHSLLKGGFHGVKVKFDVLVPGTDVFDEWVIQNAEKVRELAVACEAARVALISVATGTNDLVVEVAGQFGNSYRPFLSEKPRKNARPRLSNNMLELLDHFKPDLPLILEDVGKSGYSTTAITDQLYKIGYDPGVIFTWQRRAEAAQLDNRGIHYHAIIQEPLNDYIAIDCQTNGYCAKGWELIE